MARLPVYRNQAGVTRMTGVNIPGTLNVPRPDFSGVQNLGRAISDIAIQWQKTQDSAELLYSKNALSDKTSSLLREAEEWSGYNNPQEIKNKQKEFTERLDRLLPVISGNLTTERNKNVFKEQFSPVMQANKNRLDGIFRRKFIDMNTAELIRSEDKNRDDFIKTGDSVYKAAYEATLRDSFDAGFIDKSTMEKSMMNMDKWNFAHASYVLENDPAAALRDADEFGLTSPEVKRLKEAAAVQIKQAQYMDGLEKIVQEGTQGNRLFQKYVDGTLTLSDIMENNDISENEKKALMRLGGFSEKNTKSGVGSSGKQKKTKADPQLSVAKRLEIDGKLKELTKVEELNALRDDVYGALEDGLLTKEQSYVYLKEIAGRTYKELSSFSKEEKKGWFQREKPVENNPYILALKAVDNKLKADGYDNGTQIVADTHSLVYEAVSSQIRQNGLEKVPFENLQQEQRDKIIGGAVGYALSNVPNLTEPNTIFSMYLPQSVRADAQQRYLEQWNNKMTAQEQRKLAEDIVSAEQEKVKAQTDLTLKNAEYEFTPEDEEFLSSFNVTPEDAVSTATTYGITVEKVLNMLKEKKNGG